MEEEGAYADGLSSVEFDYGRDGDPEWLGVRLFCRRDARTGRLTLLDQGW